MKMSKTRPHFSADLILLLTRKISYYVTDADVAYKQRRKLRNLSRITIIYAPLNEVGSYGILYHIWIQ